MNINPTNEKPRGRKPTSNRSRLLRFRKSQRVTSGMRFGKILRAGKCKADHLLLVCAIQTEPDSPSRIGITIPKKTGNAVVRNLWKRLIREAFRTQQHEIPNGYDYIVRPKRGSILDATSIKKSLLKLAKRLSEEDR